ncbi:PTS transporter subunit EIIC [Lacticaseibacillus casei]|jgi:PTS system cellobiose-specific IIC component|uniref:PTS sugar transporter subunit IIC n=1 Tax=Lacticaseibacillus TaxID=2759736 RepID=UPI00080BDBF0|nr:MULTISPECIES: PTS transporter subunit EIIC [Lacticaseibacillus]QVI36099.1 PTS sugar transporter subunit IIC [Lacticaseibacillus casei]QXG60470.1 PTS transporter subunit EIIC [Lacticaseibacillus casei]WFB42379.1 PTS transporter subunit EIIC [Lacticaseibacillus huelsenbergensis]
MQHFMDWMTDSFAPKVNKLAKNPWIAAVQDGILAAMPMIFIGSFATIIGILRNYWPAIPDISYISTFSFGLFSLFLSYLVPEAIMNRKKHKDVSRQAGLAGIAFFLLLIYPSISAKGIISFDVNSLGTGGMIAALVAGIFVGFVMNIFAKMQIFGEDSALPDFVAMWFNTLIPIIVILFVGWLFTFQLHFNLYTGINDLFKPLLALGGGFWGFVIINFIGFSFLYTFGISTWVIYPIQSAIALPAIAENAKNFAAGAAVTNIYTNEAVDLYIIGGGGSTLALCIMMAFMARSARLKVVGRAGLIPSIFNINEPIIFGAPVAFNPLLMVPMWIMGLIGPIVTWFALSWRLVPIPHSVFQLWYAPFPILGYIVTDSIAGVIFTTIMFAISWLVYYPFFKAYDRQEVKNEASDDEDEEKSDESEVSGTGPDDGVEAIVNVEVATGAN